MFNDFVQKVIVVKSGEDKEKHSLLTFQCSRVGAPWTSSSSFHSSVTILVMECLANPPPKSLCKLPVLSLSLSALCGGVGGLLWLLPIAFKLCLGGECFDGGSVGRSTAGT